MAREIQERDEGYDYRGTCVVVIQDKDGHIERVFVVPDIDRARSLASEVGGDWFDALTKGVSNGN